MTTPEQIEQNEFLNFRMYRLLLRSTDGTPCGSSRRGLERYSILRQNLHKKSRSMPQVLQKKAAVESRNDDGLDGALVLPHHFQTHPVRFNTLPSANTVTV